MRGIGNIIVGVIFIIGGLSGQLVLRGTNSSGLLAVLGVGLIIWGVIKMSSGGGATPARPKMKIGGQGVVNREAVVYAQMDSLSAQVAKVAPGNKLEIVNSSETNDVLWVCVKLPDGKQGYILGHNIQ